MARRRKHGAEEMLLVPFLDILCSLIGVLILMIAALAVSQTNQIEGRDPVEVERSMNYKKLKEQQSVMQPILAALKEKLATLDTLKKETDDKEQAIAKLRRLIDNAADQRQQQQKLLKELDDLTLELEGFEKKRGELVKDIDKHRAELTERKLAPTRPPPVIVQPSGSGRDQNVKLYFVEATAGRLAIIWDAQRSTTVIGTEKSIATDKAYQYFLQNVANDGNSKLIFMLRSGGEKAYELGLGWAQQTFNLPTERAGRIPIPGAGPVDLREFKGALGTMEPPPEAKVIEAPKPAKTSASTRREAPRGAHASRVSILASRRDHQLCAAANNRLLQCIASRPARNHADPQANSDDLGATPRSTRVTRVLPFHPSLAHHG